MSVQRQITVAVDHAPAASAALRWAVGEAARLGVGVDAVHVVDVLDRADLAHVLDVPATRAQACAETQRWVHAAIDETLAEVLDRATDDSVPPMRVNVSTPTGNVEDELVKAARSAVALVLGESDGVVHEELANRLAKRCACPVLLVDEAGRAVRVRASGASRVSS